MSQMPVEVDTSITGPSTGMETGLKGIDSALSPDLSDSLLPVATSNDFWNAFGDGSTYTNFAFQQQATGTRADVVNFAKQFLGVPYVWGGTSPKGFDCSGFTQYVARRFGVDLPRISQNQANAGQAVPVNQLQPGDLVLFPGETNNGMSGPGHVALYIGNGQIIEAPHTGASVRIRALGNENVFGVHLNYPGH